ncbi:redox-regulated HSP33 family molecular chaperone [Pseudarthrobacter sp. PvP004]|uniref:hypothetical protein n=1 Tax=Pseudarthrobacter sp. PvP004 TaxID=2817850 RepID=UPI001AE7BD6F|nr:hypothetical protein [Pseudarthrobacter sp. PvP004]MBP2266270.1 redox-regulated HSP33 family molecular chaperone [Pseudarthrobacter sp. PvP004]
MAQRNIDVWGAVAAALGAALTGGALLIAALTYQRQIRDRHAELEGKRREQAEAVTVKIGNYVPAVRNFGENPEERRHLTVRNDGKLPIFNVTLVVIDKDRNESYQRHFHAIAPDSLEGSVQPTDKVNGVYATFTDTAGTRWKRWHNGDLVEIPHYPKPDE